MDELATLEELAAYLGRELTPAGSGEPATAEEIALNVASSTVRAYLGHHVTRQEELFRLDPKGSTFVRVPVFPLLDVVSVTVSGEELDPSSYAWSSTGYIIRADGLDFPKLPGSVVVVADGGFDDVPAVISGVVLSLAARLVDGSANVKQETIGTYSVTYATPTPTLQAGEMMALDAFRI